MKPRTFYFIGDKISYNDTDCLKRCEYDNNCVYSIIYDNYCINAVSIKFYGCKLMNANIYSKISYVPYYDDCREYKKINCVEKDCHWNDKRKTCYKLCEN